ncbi:unnamed protein product [Rhodiola kirilowii]
MARAGLLAWACFVIFFFSLDLTSAFIGVNWGTMASHPLPPNIVVKMLKDNGVTKVKLFDADSWTVSALAGSGMEVIVGIPNNQLAELSSSYRHAKNWVKENVTTHLYNGGVDIRYVAVGNEPFLKAYNGSNLKTLFPALQNIQKALNEAGVGDNIKAVVPQNADVYESGSNMPSDGDFRSDIKDLMLDIVNFLHDNKSPFVVNIYPFLSLYESTGFPYEFAFFDGGGKTINDKGKNYDNVFEANYDTLVRTLKKNGFSDMKIIVGEIGWPTEGHKYANVQTAKKFYDGFFKRMMENKGTPLRPGKLDVYLFGLLDEDTKSIEPGFFERHWGIFRYDGQPKFAIDLSGKTTSSNKLPIPAKGVQYLPRQWCVFNKDAHDLSTLSADMDYACSRSDCTAMAYGSSCNKLDTQGNISYAFNMYYQVNDQDVTSCDFKGLAKIVTRNASTESCLFPIQIISAAPSIEMVLGVVRSGLLGLLVMVAMEGLLW